MITQDDLQPETIFLRSFTLYRKVNLVKEPYGSVFLKVAAISFGFLMFRMMSLDVRLDPILAAMAFLACLAIGFVLLMALQLLSRIYGAARLGLYALALAAMAAFVIAVSQA